MLYFRTLLKELLRLTANTQATALMVASGRGCAGVVFKSINHSGYQPMRRKYFVTCMNLDTQQKHISLFGHMHESKYIQEKHISRSLVIWIYVFIEYLYHFLGHENG